MRFILMVFAAVFVFQIQAQSLPGQRALTCSEGAASFAVQMVVHRYGSRFFAQASFTKPMEMKRTSLNSFVGSDGEYQLILRRIEGLTFSLNVSKMENGKSEFEAMHLLTCRI